MLRNLEIGATLRRAAGVTDRPWGRNPPGAPGPPDLPGSPQPLCRGYLCMVVSSGLARGSLPYIPPTSQQEMAAVAAGAEVGLGTILLLNVADDVANNSPRCSALAAGEGHSAHGAYVMGRNLDYPLFTDPLTEFQTLFSWSPIGASAWPPWPGRDMWGYVPA